MTTPDLTPGRLDELESIIQWHWNAQWLPLGESVLLTLIAMARAKQAAERERDAYVALADTKAAEATALGRERDALRAERDKLRDENGDLVARLKRLGYTMQGGRDE